MPSFSLLRSLVYVSLFERDTGWGGRYDYYQRLVSILVLHIGQGKIREPDADRHAVFLMKESTTSNSSAIVSGQVYSLVPPFTTRKPASSDYGDLACLIH